MMLKSNRFKYNAYKSYNMYIYIIYIYILYLLYIENIVFFPAYIKCINKNIYITIIYVESLIPLISTILYHPMLSGMILLDSPTRYHDYGKLEWRLAADAVDLI